MENKPSLKDLSNKLFKNIGCLGLGGVGIVSLILLSCLITSARVIISGLIGVKPIDEETGEIITIPWLGFAIIIALGIILILIDKFYSYMRNKKK